MIYGGFIAIKPEYGKHGVFESMFEWIFTEHPVMSRLPMICEMAAAQRNSESIGFESVFEMGVGEVRNRRGERVLEGLDETVRRLRCPKVENVSLMVRKAGEFKIRKV